MRNLKSNVYLLPMLLQGWGDVGRRAREQSLLRKAKAIANPSRERKKPHSSH